MQFYVWCSFFRSLYIRLSLCMSKRWGTDLLIICFLVFNIPINWIDSICVCECVSDTLMMSYNWIECLICGGWVFQRKSLSCFHHSSSTSLSSYIVCHSFVFLSLCFSPFYHPLLSLPSLSLLLSFMLFLSSSFLSLSFTPLLIPPPPSLSFSLPLSLQLAYVGAILSKPTVCLCVFMRVCLNKCVSMPFCFTCASVYLCLFRLQCMCSLILVIFAFVLRKYVSAHLFSGLVCLLVLIICTSVGECTYL